MAESTTSKLDERPFQFARVQHPAWSHSDTLHATAEHVLEGVLYKLTRVGVVVQRGVALFRDRCTTYHDPHKKTDSTTWMLDRTCVLLPASASDLVAKKRGLRPKGTWAITAAVQGVQTYLDLFELTIDWPPSWAAAGYTSLVLGFTERHEAERWHEAVSRVLAELGPAKGHTRNNSLAPSLPDLSTASAPVTASKPEPAADGTAVPAGDGTTPESSDSKSGSSRSINMTSVMSSVAAVASEAAPRDVAPRASAAAEPASASDEDDSPSDSESDEDENVPLSVDEDRWVPCRQSNGVAIYYHAGEGKKSGGEYMVSCVIRGRPQRVANVLMRLRSNTTILGPAAHIELLQPARAGRSKDGAASVGGRTEGHGEQTEGKQVVRLVLTASGIAGFFCAPREVILERMRKDEEDGVIVILFKSVDLPNETNAKDKTDLFGTGMYRRPVRCRVAGGYTIAGLRGEGAASSESLVTCIVKADLGGVCGEGSWLHPLAFAAGWIDSFLDRILMSVQLVRDEVEQRRFIVQPFKLVASAKARFNEDGAVVGDAAAARMHAANSGSLSGKPSFLAAPGQVARSSIFRPTARMASHRLSSSTSSAIGATLARDITQEESLGGAIDPSSLHLDLDFVRSLALMPRQYWTEVQVPGTDAPFHVRGATYLKDRKKVLAGPPAFQLGSIEMIALPPVGTEVLGVPTSGTGVVEHIARFIPSIRQGGAPFSLIINLVVPGSPLLSLVAVFCCDKHPSILGPPPAQPMNEQHDWQPFDFVLHKFVYGTDETRNKMLKLIPHIASGSWMIKQSVGTTPVILGKKLKTTYHCTPTYVEVDIDISANSTANYVTGMVRGATSSLDIDLAFVLEGQAPWELPEVLLGSLRLKRLDCGKVATNTVNWDRELPLTAGPAGKL